MELSILEGKKIYFVSDHHFGIPSTPLSLQREKKFVRWLEMIESDVQTLFLLGDMFDFWFEYKEVVPKGFVRVLGKLAQMSDRGIELFFFSGNHDFWVKDYFLKELGAKVFHKEEEFLINGKRFLIGHGDGLGPRNRMYKVLKRLLKNPLSTLSFSLLHPDLGMKIAKYIFFRKKKKSGQKPRTFLGEEKEKLIVYSKMKLKEKDYDFFLFGHTHFPLDMALSPGCRYINIGDWLLEFSYGEFDGKHLKLEKFTN